ncbi:MAG: hypothetical protein KF817_05150 [Phycisphaeraceae bacterium]|nr:hypothetical protein [Phycisphaeraceae bacterium]
MNNHGDVCGYYVCGASTRRAVAWPSTGGIVTPPWPPGAGWSDAFAINDAGWVTGIVDIAGDQYGQLSFLWNIHTNEFEMIYPPFVNGEQGTSIQANAISEDRTVVGFFYTAYPESDPHAFRWKDGQFELFVGAFSGTRSQGIAIGESGAIAGNVGFYPSPLPVHPFLIIDGRITEIPTYGGWPATVVTGADDAGRFVARVVDVANGSIGIGLMGDAGGYVCELMPDWPPDLVHRVVPRGINNSGDVIGWVSYLNGAGAHALVWRSGGARRLRDLVMAPPSFGPMPINLGWPSPISQNGQVVAIGDGGYYHIVPAAPTDEDLNGDCRVDFRDLLILLSRWGSSGFGDFNGDDVIDHKDLWHLFDHWWAP